jgi:toxin FitB
MPSTAVPPSLGPIVLDSSCWLEFFAGTERAGLFAEAALHPQALVVPIITVYEVFKVAQREFGSRRASEGVAFMRRGQVIDLHIDLALRAALLNLPLADSLIYATAQAHGAVLWTQDAHFDGLPGVTYFAKAA